MIDLRVIKDLSNSSKPKPRLTGSEWADKYYYLSAESSASAGKWTTLPYQKEILDCMTDTKTYQVTLKKSARVGYNKMLNACIGYFIHQDPCSILFAQPTDDEAFGIAEDEIEPFIRDNKVVKDCVIQLSKMKKEKTAKKFYKGGILEIVGAFSPKNFRRRTVRVFIADEVDGWKLGAGEEGDQLSLGKKRTNDFWNRKILVGSTPKLKGNSKIDTEFRLGDQRYYHVPCPHCNYYHPLEFENMHFERDSDGELIKGSTIFICPKCDGHIEEKDKRKIISKGKWIATKRFNGHASFFIWSAYSYSHNSKWDNIALEYLDTEKAPMSKLQPFINTVLGEVYEPKPIEVDTTALMEKREIYGSQVPKEVLLLTCAVDVQNNRLEWEIVGWTKDETQYSIDRGVIFSDPKFKDTWIDLEKVIDTPYNHLQGKMKVYATAIDYGGSRGKFTAEFVKPRKYKRVVMIKGASSVSAPIVTYRESRNNKYATPFYMINVNDLKTLTYDSLDSIHFPKNDKYNDGYFRQLLSEEMRDGKWVKKHAKIRNEALDIKVYNLALLEIFKSEISRILSSGKPYLENRKKMVSSRVVSKGIKAFR